MAISTKTSLPLENSARWSHGLLAWQFQRTAVCDRRLWIPAGLDHCQSHSHDRPRTLIASEDPFSLSEPERYAPRFVVGFDRIEVFNCHSEGRSISLWTFDVGTGVFKNHGTAPSLWQGSSCLIFGSTPKKVPLDDGHSFILIRVDPKADGCGSDDPTNPFCQRFKSTGAFPGMTGGPAWQQTMN